MSKALIAGVGMIPFTKPGKSMSYDEMTEAAVKACMQDAGADYRDVQQVYAGFVFGDSCSGQAGLYRVGLTGVPIINVNNNCATGSSALFIARQLVEAGVADAILAVGFEMMTPGAPGSPWNDRISVTSIMETEAAKVRPMMEGIPPAPQVFGGAGIEYQNKYGTRLETFAKVSVKARCHAANNPYAIFRDPITVEDVLNSPKMFGPLTRLQCCPPSCGAAAALVVSEKYARKKGVSGAIQIVGQGMATDNETLVESGSMMNMVGYDMSVRAAKQAYENAGIGPEEADVVELHDCFTSNEIITYEALGLVAEGGAEQFILDGDNTYGGRVVTNPSGGLLSKGHPLGATGLAQCAELVWQLRGTAGARQVENAKVAVQHNVGVGGASVVSVLKAL